MLLICGAFYLPFRRYLSEKGYENSEEFFEDLLTVVTALGFIIIPLVLLYWLLFKDSSKKKSDKDSEKNK